MTTPTDPSPPPGPAQIIWDDDGAPRSALFDDIYFSREDGLEESRAVFLRGCGLPEAWRGRRSFVVAELGFGTGLNILALLDLWRRTREAGARLHVFSVEAYPLTAGAAARALAAWPALARDAVRLTAQWPSGARGFHRIDVPEDGVIIDIAILEAGEALEAWTGRADAWFLDGFSPAANPAMWREDLLRRVAARSSPGARAATFTVAGAVRRGLEAAGFTVEKLPGHGRKRQRLEARSPGEAQPRPAPRTAAIVGGGLAGAALARAFAALGVEATVIEAAAPGAGASGNPAGLVSPRIDIGDGPAGPLFAQGFARAVRLYEQTAPEAVLARGALQLEAAPRDVRRFDRATEQDIHPPGALERLDAAGAGARLGEASDAGGLWVRDALVVHPAAILDRWLSSASLIHASAAAIERAGQAWRVLNDVGAILAEADIVCIASGADLARLAPGLPVQPVRGQVTWATGPEAPVPAAWGGYLVPTPDGLLFGATHQRDDADTAVRPVDDALNLATLAGRRPALAATLEGAPLSSRASLRGATPDRLPLAGEVAPGLFVLGGLGGRGFTIAPILAEHVAALAVGAPSPLPARSAAAVDPRRFEDRARREQTAAGRVPSLRSTQDVQETSP